MEGPLQHLCKRKFWEGPCTFPTPPASLPGQLLWHAGSQGMLSLGGACSAAWRCNPRQPHSPAPTRAARAVRRRLRAAPPRAAAASGGNGSGDPALSLSFDNACDEKSTVIFVKASNRPGVLHAITTTFKDLALSVNKAEVDMDGDLLSGAPHGGAESALP